MGRLVALIVGASGHVGSQLAKELFRSGGWEILALSHQSRLNNLDVRTVHVDLLRGDVAGAINAVAKPTHVFYCARAPHKESGTEDIESNVAMLRKVVEASEHGNPDLAHVHIVEGGKWYGAHLGSYKTPAREDDLRHAGENFYYDQEDWLCTRQVGKTWTWTASRPSYVCAVTPGRGRNLVSTLGAYAAFCKSEGQKLEFPGSERSFLSLTEMTDAQLLARAIIFMATTSGAANQAFNVTNGDAIRWSEFWPKLAEFFQVQVGGARDFKLAEWSGGKKSAWDRLVREHSLQTLALHEVANWQFGDFVFGQDYDVLSDTAKLRHCGFRKNVNTTEMILSMLRSYQREAILP